MLEFLVHNQNNLTERGKKVIEIKGCTRSFVSKPQFSYKFAIGHFFCRRLKVCKYSRKHQFSQFIQPAIFFCFSNVLPTSH